MQRRYIFEKYFEKIEVGVICQILYMGAKPKDMKNRNIEK